MYSYKNVEMFDVLESAIFTTQEQTTQDPQYLAEKEQKEAELEQLEEEIKKLGFEEAFSVEAMTQLRLDLKSISTFRLTLKQRKSSMQDILAQDILNIAEVSKNLILEKGFSIEGFNIIYYFNESKYRFVSWEYEGSEKGKTYFFNSENTSWHEQYADREESLTLNELAEIIAENSKLPVEIGSTEN